MFLLEIAIDLTDIIAIIISFFYVFLIIGVVKALKNVLDMETRRKFTHTSMGIWPFLWFLYDHLFAAFLVPLIVTIMLAIAPKSMRELFSRGDEKHIGLVLYALSFTLMTLFFFKSWIGASAIFVLAFADGIGGWVGRKKGKHMYKVPWAKPKSIEGSLGMFLASLISIFIAQLVFQGFIDVLIIFIGSLIATIVEGISPKHSDNIFIPVILAGVLYLISFY